MRYPKPTIPPPNDRELLEMLQASVMDTRTTFETSDGCEVEPDGTCEHGHPTWLVRQGWI